MSRRMFVLGPLVALLLASCGSSSQHTSAGGSTTSQTPPPGSTASTPATTATKSTTGPAPGPGPGTPGSTGAAPGPNQEKIRLPANFTIRSGGSLSPRSVSSPSFLAVSLSVVSADGKAHRVVVRTPKPHVLLIRAGGRTSTLISGLPAGRYSILVDGVVRGALDIGGEPGP